MWTLGVSTGTVGSEVHFSGVAQALVVETHQGTFSFTTS